ncbi:HsdR family type I site-specific deoxyribonuclease [Thiothrix lacustris]|uniref:Type I restriction enzyme endonuclease subunit n=1 Tax=Thiothrix lacustris TaxID=525917 RepID=A0ABY9MQ95_9GAMM|nr:HsdR family type I site-specific deoxyribonuclease [Thiothrix lacustris]WML90809.1 HsdR family type I site-specific deoxyribonuclease [Thiothrix lacustris]
MSNVSDRERITQNRVIRLFQDKLGYEYLGNWEKRANNRNIEPDYLSAWLRKQHVSDTLIDKTLQELARDNALDEGNNLYTPNQTLYGFLRYGVKIKPDHSEHTRTIHLIDWANPTANDFAIAEEVTISGKYDKRPDIVLYVNGIALGVLELKRATVGVAEGIAQNLDNQSSTFIRPFFTTMQLVMAGNDSEGLRYGTIETQAKYYLEWREENPAYNPKTDSKDQQYLPQYNCGAVESPLDCALLRIASKHRLLELIHDFVVFDAGVKKLCRHNQYFGLKAAQARIRQREGGIIWHTQGSGKSLTMVWLAKWLRENVDDSRVLIITDRTELDEQIEGVFKGVDEHIYRCTSGRDMVGVLNQPIEWLMCSLIHKFGAGEEGSEQQTSTFIKELLSSIPKDFSAKGNLFVFVDECHRTQSGKLHSAMQKLLPNALFVGFTGTPLLDNDKQASIATFGSFIHTYKFDQAVNDKVVLDLCYEARDISQYIGNKTKVDEFFELKTKGLSKIAKVRVKQKWLTMQSVLSSKSRLQEIVNDIVLDMETKPRLESRRGNAMLVCADVYQACKVYELFAATDPALASKTAIITSYQPTAASIKGEGGDEGNTENLHKYKIYRKMLAAYFNQPEDEAVKRVEEFEKKVKKQFKEQPAQMRLLIVVDKLLTGFDAPSATYLYIDKKMQNHGLFQAICRVNRLDGEEKTYGYIIDYKDLFNSIKDAMSDYTGGAFAEYDSSDVQDLLKNRLKQAKLKLEETREAIKALCEPVALPRDTNDYLAYFVSSNTLNRDEAEQNEGKRLLFYKLSGAYLRAYAEIAGELSDVGYSTSEADKICAEVRHYHDAREAVKLASRDYQDAKDLEPAMRHIFDQFIRADDSDVLADFGDKGLIEVLVDSGIAALEKRLPENVRKNAKAVAETIENNIRKSISDTRSVNPAYYDNLSALLDALIQSSNAKPKWRHINNTSKSSKHWQNKCAKGKQHRTTPPPLKPKPCATSTRIWSVTKA